MRHGPDGTIEAYDHKGDPINLREHFPEMLSRRNPRRNGWESILWLLMIGAVLMFLLLKG